MKKNIFSTAVLFAAISAQTASAYEPTTGYITLDEMDLVVGQLRAEIEAAYATKEEVAAGSTALASGGVGHDSGSEGGGHDSGSEGGGGRGDGNGNGNGKKGYVTTAELEAALAVAT